MSDTWLRTVVLAATLVGLAQSAVAQERHCPPATSANSHIFFGVKSDPTADKDRLVDLAQDLARDAPPVCILALIDPVDTAHSKKLALRRVLWVRQNLISNGVPAGVIAEEFRMGPPSQEKDGLRAVSVIIGR